jgi:antibiotic biosynthesis monooxygenase
VNFRLAQFNLGSGNEAAAEALATKLVPAIRSQPGCQSCTFFADHANGDYGLAVMWESREAADAAAGVIGPILMGGVREANGTMQSPRLFDVIEP